MFRNFEMKRSVLESMENSEKFRKKNFFLVLKTFLMCHIASKLSVTEIYFP